MTIANKKINTSEISANEQSRVVQFQEGSAMEQPIQCRNQFHITKEEFELAQLDLARAEQRLLQLQERAELSRMMSEAPSIRRETLTEFETIQQSNEARRQQEAEELQARHQREREEERLEGQRLTCMTDAELVAHKVASIPVATLNAERRAEVRSRARGRSPARARASSPARARAPSPTPSNEGSRQGGRATAVQKDRSCAGCDIRVGDEIEFKLPKEEQTWRVLCLSANGTGSFRVLRSSNSPEFVGRQYSTGKSPINSAFQDYCFSLGIAKQAKTPWAGNMYKYRNGVSLGKQK
jgi:hypothetical protein